jgi:hypothetical protein
MTFQPLASGHRREHSKFGKSTTNDFRPAHEVSTGCVGWGVAL